MGKLEKGNELIRECLHCGKDISHKHKNAKFCCIRHKDKYHNIHNPRGIYSHLIYNEQEGVIDTKDDEYYYTTIHPFDPEALGQG